ncbi:MAG: histidinol phosphatase, partial [Chloroflexi bacterium]|nr:histidinol phosphatase [Chloroflexota bacterium]
MSAAAVPEYGPDWSASLRRGTDAELRGWVEAALGWCDEADAIARAHFRREVEVTRKPDRSFVTAADTAIEQLVRDRVAATFPAHGVVGEEYGSDRPDATVRWYVDPIDGTHNYLRGVPVFATLLAVERDGELQAGVLSAPALGGRWHAWRGGGAWARWNATGDSPRRIRVSGIASIDEAQVLYAGTRDVIASGRAPGFEGLLDAAWRERGLGDFWGYTLLAEGAAEAMIEVELSIWDTAAP